MENRNRISYKKFGCISTSPYEFNFKIEEMLTTLPCQLPKTSKVDCDTTLNVGVVSLLDTQWGAASSVSVQRLNTEQQQICKCKLN